MALFSDVLEVRNGKNQKAVEDPNGRYPIYGSGGEMGRANDYLCEAQTVIVGRKGNINNPLYVDEPFWNVDTAFGLVPNKEVLLPKYLFFFCEHFDFSRLNKAVTIPSLTKADLLKIRIDLPTIEEQGSIVDRLVCIEALHKKENDMLRQLDQLVKSRFVEMFGSGESSAYGIVEVEQLCAAIVDCPHETPKYQGELIHPAIRTSELPGTSLAWETMKYVSQEEYERRIRRLKPMPGDIVYAREGIYGTAAILPTGYDFCLGQRTMLFRPNYEICTSEYLLHALTSDGVMKQADSLNSGSTVPHVNVKDAKRFRVPVPPVGLQKAFAAFVSQVDKSKSVVQKSIEQLELLKASLMQEYFG